MLKSSIIVRNITNVLIWPHFTSISSS